MDHNLPNALFIGYMKSGTTYLRSYFTQHRSIRWARKAWLFQLEMTDDERTRVYSEFFKNEPAHPCFIDMYEGLSLGYCVRKSYEGQNGPEWDPSWAVQPHSPLSAAPVITGHHELVRRIKATLPDARIIVVLRNQTDWLRSMYLHHFCHMRSGENSFIDFLSTVEGKTAVASACYDRTLEIYERHFGRERLHVMLLEDIERKETETLTSLCTFLNIPFQPIDHSSAEKNKGLSQPAAVKQVRLRQSQGWLSYYLMRLSGKKDISDDILAGDEKAFIRSFYAESNMRTAEWLAKDISQIGYTQ